MVDKQYNLNDERFVLKGTGAFEDFNVNLLLHDYDLTVVSGVVIGKKLRLITKLTSKSGTKENEGRIVEVILSPMIDELCPMELIEGGAILTKDSFIERPTVYSPNNTVKIFLLKGLKYFINGKSHLVESGRVPKRNKRTIIAPIDSDTVIKPTMTNNKEKEG